MYGEYEDQILEKLHNIELMILNDFMELCDKNGLEYFAISGSAIGTLRHKGFIPWDDDIDIAMLREDYEKFVKLMDSDKEFSAKYELWGPDREKKYYNFQPTLSLKGTVFVNRCAGAAGYKPGILMDIFPYDKITEDREKALKVIKKSRRLAILYNVWNVNYFKILKGESTVQKIKNIICGVMRIFMRLIPGIEERIYKKFLSYTRLAEKESDTYTCLFDPGAHIMHIKKAESYPTVEMPFEDTKIRLVKNYHEQLTQHMGSYMEVPPEDKRTNHKPNELDFGNF